MLLALLTVVVRRLYAGLSTTRDDPRPDFADV